MSRIHPADLNQFSVIRLNWDFGERVRQDRLFVLLGHYPTASVYTLKATSKTERYERNPDRLRGVVLYEPEELELGCFPERTVIELDNGWQITYAQVLQAQNDYAFTLEGDMPGDFASRLRTAFDNSITLDGEQRRLIQNALARPNGGKK